MKIAIWTFLVMALSLAGCGSQGDLSGSEQDALKDKLSQPVNSPGNPGQQAKPAGPPSGGPPAGAEIKGDKVTD